MKWVLFTVLFMAQAATAQKQVAFLGVVDQPEDLASNIKVDYQEIPFEVINGMILLEASVDHQRGYFILDTGAPQLVLNRRNPPSAKRTLTGSSCSGTIQLGSKEVRHFAFGNSERFEIQALTADLSHLERATQRRIAGLIGFQMLKDREVFINYDEQRLILFDARKDNLIHRSATPIQSVAIVIKEHLPIVQLQIGDQLLSFGIDTGSESNLLDNCALDRLQSMLVDTIDEEEIQGLDKAVKKVPVVKVRQNRLEQLPLEALTYLVTDLCHLEKTSRLNIDGLLGFPFLRQLKISINFEKQKLYVWDWAHSL